MMTPLPLESSSTLELEKIFQEFQQTVTILIVDDNPTNLSVLNEYLVSSGYKTRIARDGESALQRVDYDPPNLILLDVMMPGLDGFETCRRLKANPNHSQIPIIFMSALSETVDKVRGLKLGAVDYITKPFQQEEVKARIQIHLQIQSLTHTLLEQTRALAVQNLHLNREVQEHQRARQALEELQEQLEQKVVDRTAQLTQALADLQQLQVQIVQAEKMSALGQLVAGIAHEVNNPINFIYANLEHAKHYTHQLLHLLRLQQQELPHPSAALQELIEEADLDFIATDLPKLITSMGMGADRIRKIVLSLRHFSRIDEADLKAVDIHEGIDSTLLILHSRLKASGPRAEIEVVKNYGPLPLVECYAGQLNQVFMNLLANAIDALEEQPTHPGRIEIETTFDDQQIRIRIADNGAGIPEEIRSRLFTPFFTTKPVGKGTGLGLSISYQIIVEKHGGQITCQSQLGQGTEFVIAIPRSRVVPS